MSRLSIEVSEQEHQRIKALAALDGSSIKDFILKKTLKSEHLTEAQALSELEACLAPRIKEAAQGTFSRLTMQEIRAKARKDAEV